MSTFITNNMTNMITPKDIKYIIEELEVLVELIKSYSEDVCINESESKYTSKLVFKKHGHILDISDVIYKNKDKNEIYYNAKLIIGMVTNEDDDHYYINIGLLHMMYDNLINFEKISNNIFNKSSDNMQLPYKTIQSQNDITNKKNNLLDIMRKSSNDGIGIDIEYIPESIKENTNNDIDTFDIICYDSRADGFVKQGTEYSSGYDIPIVKFVERLKGNVLKFETGVTIRFPKPSSDKNWFTYGKIYPRSSLHKTNLIYKISAGIIDNDYTGKLYALFQDFTIYDNDTPYEKRCPYNIDDQGYITDPIPVIIQLIPERRYITNVNITNSNGDKHNITIARQIRGDGGLGSTN